MFIDLSVATTNYYKVKLFFTYSPKSEYLLCVNDTVLCVLV